MDIVVKLDTAPLVQQLRDIRGGVDTAARRAINRTAMEVRTAATREIAADVGLPYGVVRRAMKLIRATFRTLEAIVEVTGRRIPLIDFKARGPEPSRGRGRGVSYGLRGGRGRHPQAFIARMRSGHRGVFERREAQGPQKLGAKGPILRVPRTPIRELFGPSLPRVFANAKVSSVIRRIAAASLEKNLAHEVQFLLRGRGQLGAREDMV